MKILKKRKIVISIGVILALLAALFIWKDSKSVEDNLDVSCIQFTLASAKANSDKIKGEKNQYVENLRDINGLSAEGGQQTTYTNQAGNTMFTNQVFYGETGRSEVEYYYLDGKLFYLSKTNYTYLNPITVDPSGEIAEVEGKQFLLGANNIVCEWYENNELQDNGLDTQDLVNFLVNSLEKEEEVSE